MYLSITRSPLHFLSSPHPCQSILKWHSTYLPIPLLDLLLCLSHPFNMHPPEDVSAWKSNNPKTFYQFFEVTSYLWRHQSVLGTFSIFWPCLKEKKKNRNKNNPNDMPKEAAVTSQQYNRISWIWVSVRRLSADCCVMQKWLLWRKTETMLWATITRPLRLIIFMPYLWMDVYLVWLNVSL